MTRLNRILLIVLVVQLGLLIAVRLATRSDHKATPRAIFAGLDQAKISSFKVEDDKKNTVELAKKGEDWLLVSGGGYPADKAKVSEFLAKLPDLKAGAPVATRTAHHRALEVADKGFQRRVTLVQQGGQKLAFYLGSSAGIRSVHLRQAGQEEVYLADGLTAWDAGVNASDWINTEYFKVDKDKVVALTLRNAAGELSLQKDAQGSWTLAGIKPEEKLDSTAVDTLVSTASMVSLKQPVGKEVKPEQGLKQPQVTVTLVTETKSETKAEEQPAPSGKQETPAAGIQQDQATVAAGQEGQPGAAMAEPAPAATAEPGAATAEPAPVVTRATHTLRIGAKQDDSYYAKSEGSPFVVRLATWAVEPLVNKKPADLLKKEEQGQGAGEQPPAPGLPLGDLPLEDLPD